MRLAAGLGLARRGAPRPHGGRGRPGRGRPTASSAYEAIIDTASKKGCDLILMASHGRKGISAFVIGSETYKVLSHSKIPVLVCR